MKKFCELKEGDFIYYWDHGTIHSQIVKSIENTVETQEHTNWDGNKWTSKHEWTIINAGKSKYPLKLNKFMRIESSDIIGMRRFADLEAVKEWINKRYTIALNNKYRYLQKLSRSDKAISTYKKVLDFINNEKVLS